MINLALFASGNGSNVEAIYNYIKSRKLNDSTRNDSMDIKMVFVNNKDAYVIKRCIKLNIPYFVFNSEQLNNVVIDKLIENKIDFIALCEFLNLIPKEIIKKFPKKIVNIHPALLPKYGGKDMCGMRVHTQVIENKETYSGISIHYVNEKYDEGQIIFKVRTTVSSNDNPESLSNKIHSLEHKYYPVIIYSLATNP
jgi:phosphoribosylglycinamide formyltransferase 1